MPKGLRCELEVPEPVFMIAKLIEGAAAELKGVARYHEAFREFE